MSLFPPSRDGYYDDSGQWNRTKRCFMSCGERCTCTPPNGLWYDERKDKSKQPTQPSESEEVTP